MQQDYRVFTRDYDVEGHVRDLSDRIWKISPDGSNGLLKETEGALRSRAIDLDLRITKGREDLDDAAIYRQLAALTRRDAVTLLIDHSGSMRGDRSVQVAASVLLFAEMAQRCSFQFEILGFSTAGWRGGFARLAWKKAGSPPIPGRLCALHHVVHKDFAEPSLETSAVRMMINENLLRENVDGEAIEWAIQRLRRKTAQRKFLIVISDGAPVDDSTLMENDDAFLWRHLRQVIDSAEQKGEILVGAVQVGGEFDSLYSYTEIASDRELVAPLVKLIGRLADHAGALPIK